MSIRTILLSATSLGLLVSCDPRVFDDLADSTWVHSAGKPGDLGSAGYGVGLIGVSDGTGDMRYVVAAEQPAATVWANFDKSGSRSVHVEDFIITQPATDPLITPAVMASDVTEVTANIAVAATAGANAPMLFILSGENGIAAAPIPLTGNASPTGIAFGLTDIAGGIDLFAVAGNDLNLVANYHSDLGNQVVISCGLGATGGDVMVADVDSASESEVLIAFGGSVTVTTGTGLAAASTATEACFASLVPIGEITAPGGEASFGNVLRSGDFDGDGNTDIVISAPDENAVYVFSNWTDSASTGTKITTPSGAVAFGSNIAVGDFDGDGTDELVISDQGAEAEGKSNAGTVYIYSDGFGTPIELYDASPETDQKFGQSVAVVKAFGGDSLVVGADDEIFTYFRTPVSGDGDSRE